MLAKKVFFSFLEVTDPSRHHEYNAYHQLDHRPENLALPSVRWGDRWVRTPECAAMSTGADARLRRMHYTTMYWFTDPVDRSVAEWAELGELAFQWGRRPDTDWADRQVGFFRPLKGYVNPRVLVSPDALPFRPVRGMLLNVLRVHEPRSAATEQAYAWYDRVHIPQVLECDGVAGVWTFVDDDRGLRVHLAYCDEVPSVVLASLGARRELMAAGMPDLDGVVEELLFTPMEPITPWKWDWFDPS
jgi:hypothetical protein